MTQSSRWNQQAEKGSFFLLRLTLWLYRCLGRRIFKLILAVIIFWYWLFSVKTRHYSLQYLQRVDAFSRQENQNSFFKQQPTIWHTYQHLYQFGESILDKMHAWSGGIAEHDLTLFNHEVIRQYYGQGAVIIVSHFGNIELLRAIKSEHFQIVNVLVYHQHAEQFNQFLQSINPKAGVRLISVADMGVETALLLQQRLDAGEWIIVAADRIPVQSSRQQAVHFLGQSAEFPEGAWWLAHLLNAPVLSIFCYRVQQKIELHIHHLSENLQLPRKNRAEVLHQFMEKYVKLLQDHCMKAPYQWFNFFDFWNENPR